MSKQGWSPRKRSRSSSAVAVASLLLLLAAHATAPAQTPGTPSQRVFKPLPPPAAFAPPILEVTQPVYKWGSVYQGELVKHTFQVVNKGGAPLIITQVKPSCGCTTTGKPEQPIEPGQSGGITLEIDTKKFSGHTSKSADVYSNASATPVKISMEGGVDPFFTLEPQAPKIELIRGIPASPVTAVLRRSIDKPLNLKGLKTESKIVTASMEEKEPGQTFELTLNANVGDDPRKYYYEELQATLEVEGKEFSIPLRISVNVKDRIEVLPRTSVYFSRTETKPLKDGQGVPTAKMLDIQSLAGDSHTFRITEVSSGANAFDAKLETVEDGKHYRLFVNLSKLPQDASQRTVRDTIVLKTDDPTVGELKITALAALQ